MWWSHPPPATREDERKTWRWAGNVAALRFPERSKRTLAEARGARATDGPSALVGECWGPSLQPNPVTEVVPHSKKGAGEAPRPPARSAPLPHRLHVKHWGLDELGAQVGDDEARDAEGHPVRPQRADDEHALHLVAGVFPLAWGGKEQAGRDGWSSLAWRASSPASRAPRVHPPGPPCTLGPERVSLAAGGGPGGTPGLGPLLDRKPSPAWAERVEAELVLLLRAERVSPKGTGHRRGVRDRAPGSMAP